MGERQVAVRDLFRMVVAGIPNPLDPGSWFLLWLVSEGLFDPLIQPSQSLDLDKEIHKLFRPQGYGIRSVAPAGHGVPRQPHLLSQSQRGDFQLLEDGFEFLSMHDGRIEYRNVGRVQKGRWKLSP